MNEVSSNNNSTEEMTAKLDQLFGKAADDQEYYDMILDEVADEYIDFALSSNQPLIKEFQDYDTVVRQRYNDIDTITNDVMQKYQDLKIDDDSLASLKIKNTVGKTLDVPLYYNSAYDMNEFLFSNDFDERRKLKSDLVKNFPYQTIDEYNSHK